MSSNNETAHTAPRTDKIADAAKEAADKPNAPSEKKPAAE